MMPSTHQAMTDAQVLAATLAEDAGKRSGDHPQLDQLSDYLAGELAPEAEARIQDHLVACRTCTTQLLDLESLSEPGPRTAGGVADLALAAAWREQKTRIAELEGARRRQRTMRWVSAVAASLFVATVGLSVHVSQLRRTIAGLEAPEINPPVVHLDASASRSGTEAKIVELGPDDRSLILSITPLAAEWPAYQVEVLSASGSEVWAGSDLTLSGYGTIELRISRALLPAGAYKVRLHGVDGDRREELQATQLVVRDK